MASCVLIWHRVVTATIALQASLEVGENRSRRGGLPRLSHPAGEHDAHLPTALAASLERWVSLLGLRL